MKLVVALIVLTAASFVRAAPPAPTPGHIHERSKHSENLEVRSDYFFDANALDDAVVAGDGVIAVTSSGVLLRFSASTLNLEVQRVAPRPVAAIGALHGEELLAGLDDGRIFQVNTRTLQLSLFKTVEGTPRWISAYTESGPGAEESRHCPVIVTSDRNEKELEFKAHDLDRGEVCDLPLPRSIRPRAPSAYHLDQQRRLWIGVHAGEWGGSATYIDLTNPDEGPGSWGLNGMSSGVMGFAELRDGAVLVCGGNIHWGLGYGHVSRSYGEDFENLARFGGGFVHERSDSPTTVGAHITTIVEEEQGTLIVVSNGEIFRYDREFKSGHFLGRVPQRTRWGQDAGYFPPVRNVHVLSSNPLTLLIATACDGLVRWTSEGTKDAGISGQLETEALGLLPSDSGVVFVSRLGRGLPYTFTGKKWELHPVVEGEPLSEGKAWGDHRTYAVRGGKIRTVVCTSLTPGELAVTEWRQRRRNLVQHVATKEYLSLFDIFVTPDGRVWNCDDGKLLYLENDAWVETGARLKSSSYRPATEAGPPWLLLAEHDDRLLTLDDDGEDVRVEFLDLYDSQGRELAVLDATPWRSGLLLASSRGLRFLPSASAQPRRAAFVAPAC